MVRVTIKDIAARAGVAPSVVSNVLTGRNCSRCSPRKRQEILDAVRETNYRPNRAAQGLVKKKSKLVGLLSYSPRDPAAARIIAEVHDQLSRRAYGVICGFWNNADNVKSAFDSVLSYPLDGLICLHDSLFELIPEGLPAVYGSAELPGKNCVLRDRLGYFEDAGKFLRELGHEKIGFFGSNNPLPGRNFLDMVRRYGFVTKKEWCPMGSGFFDDSLELGRRLFAQKELPSALLCHNDLTAFAALKTAKEAGIRVPEELTVIGSDGLDGTRYCDPPLTTFRFQVDKYVERILDKLFGSGEPGIEYIPMMLELRESHARRMMNDE